MHKLLEVKIPKFLIKKSSCHMKEYVEVWSLDLKVLGMILKFFGLDTAGLGYQLFGVIHFDWACVA